VLRERILPRWSGLGLLGAVGAFVPLVVAPAWTVDASVTVGPLPLQGEDALTVAAALGWTLLGAGLLRRAAR
jgi:hypothetical protein